MFWFFPYNGNLPGLFSSFSEKVRPGTNPLFPRKKLAFCRDPLFHAFLYHRLFVVSVSLPWQRANPHPRKPFQLTAQTSEALADASGRSTIWVIALYTTTAFHPATAAVFGPGAKR